MYGLTILVVDGDERARNELLLALRRLGVRALGLTALADASALLAALDADVLVVRSDEREEELEPLRRRTIVLSIDRAAVLEDAVVSLLRALGRPEEAASLN